MRSKFWNTPILTLVFILVGCVNDVEENPPNIIVIMSDDMGFSDIASYGSEIPTPNLDELALNGLRFKQFYNTARCCPTRASLLTGLYPQQAGIGHMVRDRGTPAYRGDLSFNAITIAEVLKQNGYSTFMSGKWHVTPFQSEDPDKSNWPKQRGFDRFFGMIAGAGSFYDPKGLVEENEYSIPWEEFYATDAFSDKAIDFLETRDESKPFFLYLAYTAAHWPLHAPQEVVNKYKGRYDKGWDVIREERYQRMIESGLIESNWPLTKRDSLVTLWDRESKDAEWELRNMEVYAAMIDIMDQGIGRVVQSLKAAGQFDNTLLIFLQDNGACAEVMGHIKPSPPQEELDSMGSGQFQINTKPLVTRDGRRVNFMRESLAGPDDSYTAYGPAWANVSNTPFREYKHWVHEGGIASPLIIHWPKGIEQPNRWVDDPSHLIDIMATCLDVSGASYPKMYQGREIIPMMGQSLVPTFKSNSMPERPIFWEHEGNRAVRLGKWKLVSKAIRINAYQWDKVEELQKEDWELFDMELDRTELNDISHLHPELVNELSMLWLEWAKEVGAVPRPN